MANQNMIMDPEVRMRSLNERIRQLGEEIVGYEKLVTHYRAELAKADHMRLSESDKWRKREEALVSELRITRAGAPGSCACPAGKCLKTATKGQLCWAQWAGLTAVQAVAQRAIDQALRDVVHPSRAAEAQRQDPAVAQQGKLTMPHICDFQYQAMTGRTICHCGRELP